ncbi:MAG: arylsulfatase [Ignavibacteria bacterium]|nr:arylsulfatase [Ignavibacteria bacterium]
MNKNIFKKQILLVPLIVPSVSIAHCFAQTRPNVVLIVADDMGWNDVSYHGSEIKTPTIDRLAKEGVELNRFYAHPTCSPSRSALMTGKAPLRLGILTPLAKNNELGLPLSETTMAEYFKNNGYQTSLIGKWHLGRFKKEYWPTHRGFDHFYGYLTGGVGHYDHVHGGGLDWQQKGKTLRKEGYSTHLLSTEAIEVIETRHQKQPFFLELCFAAPHLPNEAPDSSVAKYKHLPNKNRQLHAAMVSEVDYAIQKIYKTLEKEGLLENTIIWFFSDNGGLNESAYPDSYTQPIEKLTKFWGTPLPIDFFEFVRINIKNAAADNSPFKAGKGSTYEGGVRVPSFIYAPQYLKQKIIDERITINDVLPSLAAAIGFKNFKATDLDGVNQWAYLSGKADYISTDYVVHGMYGSEAYYQDNWKLVVNTDEAPELYNLQDDPTETTNVAANYSAIVAQLSEKLKAFPRGKSIHESLLKTALDMDSFGGKEDRMPWAGVEGKNAGPLHPIYIIVPTFLLGIVGIVWYRIRRKKVKKFKS